MYIPLSSLSDPLSNRQMSNYDQLLQFVAGNDKGNKSLSKIDASLLPQGYVFNLKFTPNIVNNEANLKKIESFNNLKPFLYI